MAAFAFMSATSRSSFSVREALRMELNCRAVRNISRARIVMMMPARNAQAIRNSIDAWIVRPYQYQNVTSGPMFLMMKTSRYTETIVQTTIFVHSLILSHMLFI